MWSSIENDAENYVVAVNFTSVIILHVSYILQLWINHRLSTVMGHIRHHEVLPQAPRRCCQSSKDVANHQGIASKIKGMSLIVEGVSLMIKGMSPIIRGCRQLSWGCRESSSKCRLSYLFTKIWFGDLKSCQSQR